MTFSWKNDEFSTQIFGFKSAKIESLDRAEELNRLFEELIENKIEYATYRVSANNFPIIHALENSGFLLVDGLISLDADISKLEIENNDSRIREANENDLEETKVITEGLFSVSRIYNDPLISKEKADSFYKKWIENSIRGIVADSVLVWFDGEVQGYVTLQKKGQIPLIGVAKEAQGKGIAKKLIKSSFNRFKEWGINTVKIETQMGNIPALRLDLNCGFNIVDSFLTFRWSGPEERRRKKT